MPEHIPEYLKRALQEQDDLANKIKKLDDFIHSEKYRGLTDTHQQLMCYQIRSMRRYLIALKSILYINVTNLRLDIEC
jgi:hypothetical protein